jgi:hypothetical protein
LHRGSGIRIEFTEHGQCGPRHALGGDLDAILEAKLVLEAGKIGKSFGQGFGMGPFDLNIHGALLSMPFTSVPCSSFKR